MVAPAAYYLLEDRFLGIAKWGIVGVGKVGIVKWGWEENYDAIWVIGIDATRTKDWANIAC